MVKKIVTLGIVLLSIIQIQAQSTSGPAVAVPSAGAVIATATSRAGKSGKNVFLIFHASWCGWCHKMDTAMADPAIQKYFDDNYVVAHLTVKENGKNKLLENQGGMELLDKYTRGKQTGIPFWVILDKNGQLLADAFLPNGDNAGCPAAANEVDQFITVLKKTSKLDDKALGGIRERFLKNQAGH